MKRFLLNRELYVTQLVSNVMQLALSVVVSWRVCTLYIT